MTRKRVRKRSTGKPQITLRQDDYGARLLALQKETHRIATTWHEGLGLDYIGVNLGQCLEYNVLNSVNTITRGWLDGEREQRQQTDNSA
jgi:hypothetical protein